MADIFTLTIECTGGGHVQEPYQFVFEAPVTMKLGELASHILDIVAFDDLDHLDDFYFANPNGGGRKGLGPDGDWGDDNGAIMKMKLSEVYPAPKNKKLFYLFDFGASWYFRISKPGKEKKPQAGVTYPRLVSETGVKPTQYEDDDDEE